MQASIHVSPVFVDYLLSPIVNCPAGRASLIYCHPQPDQPPRKDRHRHTGRVTADPATALAACVTHYVRSASQPGSRPALPAHASALSVA